MFRFASSALLISVFVAGCDSTPPEAALVSQAVAAPGNAAPGKGWQSSVSPTAVEDTVVEYE